MCHRWFANFDWVSIILFACQNKKYIPSAEFSHHISLPNSVSQDALLEYRMEAPYIPEAKDPDQQSSDMDGDVEGFASDFL